MKRTLYGALAIAAGAAAMAVPSSAAADTTGTIACDKPVAQCVKELLTYDPCLTCTIDDEVNDGWEVICEAIWARDCSNDDIWPL